MVKYYYQKYLIGDILEDIRYPNNYVVIACIYLPHPYNKNYYILNKIKSNYIPSLEDNIVLGDIISIYEEDINLLYKFIYRINNYNNHNYCNHCPLFGKDEAEFCKNFCSEYYKINKNGYFLRDKIFHKEKRRDFVITAIFTLFPGTLFTELSTSTGYIPMYWENMSLPGIKLYYQKLLDRNVKIQYKDLISLGNIHYVMADFLECHPKAYEIHPNEINLWHRLGFTKRPGFTPCESCVVKSNCISCTKNRIEIFGEEALLT